MRPKLQAIDNRIASLTKTSVLLQEDVQVMRYLKVQFYDQHHDYFDPPYYKKDPGFLIQLKDGRNRLATVLWYLNTIFPLADGNRWPINGYGQMILMTTCYPLHDDDDRHNYFTYYIPSIGHESQR